MTDKGDTKRIQSELDQDKRDVSDLWNEALRNYKGIVGVALQPKFASVQEMIDAGTAEMNAFHKFRHNDKKVDKLRKLFISNMDYIEKGTQQLIAAATPAFPPAAAIGTALTLMLSACKQVSADYDVVTAFFEDLNAFLQRITILESRLPSYPAYRNCLMDVFTALVEMCGFATKYTELGRFKKWVFSMIKGGDGELAGARGKMDQNLSRLQSATEYAILGNTEKLQDMNAELQRNEQMQTQMLEEQTRMLEMVIEGQDSLRDELKDFRKVLSMFEERKREDPAKPKGTKSGKPPTSNHVRSCFTETLGPELEYQNIKDSFIEEMSTWIFDEEAWDKWAAQERSKGTSKILSIAGPSGTGKSHLAASMYDRLMQSAEAEATCVVHFYFREMIEDIKFFFNAIKWIAIQIAEQNTRLCERMNSELAREDIEIDDDWKDIWGKLYRTSFHSNVSLVCTTRPQPSLLKELEGLGSDVLRVSSEQQLPDLKALVWYHLNGDNGLKRLSRYMKQKISSRLEENATCLLYAEHLLRRYNSLGRGPLIERELEQPMPEDLEHLFAATAADLLRRTSPTQQKALENLFMWLAFSIRPLTLNEILYLVRLLPGDMDFEEELQSPQLARFVRIAGAEEAMLFDSRSSGIEELQEQQEGPDTLSDGNLPVKFQERSMREFFRSVSSSEDNCTLRTPAFEAHRRMFITLSEILSGVAEKDVPHGLLTYAARNWFTHLHAMSQSEACSLSTVYKPESKDLAVFLEAVGAVMTAQADVSANIEVVEDPVYTEMDRADFNATIGMITNLATQIPVENINKSTASWTKHTAADQNTAFADLARAHVENWFKAKDKDSVNRSYEYARSALAMTNMKYLIKDAEAEDHQYDSEEIIAIWKAFPPTTGPKIPWTFISLLAQSEHFDLVLLHAKQALEDATSEPVQRFQILKILAHSQYKLEDYPTAFSTIASAWDHDIPAWLLRGLFVTRARIEAELGRTQDAVASYREARVAPSDKPMPGNGLHEEFDIHLTISNDLDCDFTDLSIVSLVESWTSLERLVWMTWDYGFNDQHHVEFRRACGRSGKTQFMTSTYNEVITLLDTVNSGAPMRRELAIAQREICGDLDAAKALWNEILDTTSNGDNLRFTNEDPAFTLIGAVNSLADIIYEQFRTTADKNRKNELLQEMRGLTSRDLARSISSSSSMINHYSIVLAKMVRKMGPVEEFEKLLRAAFDVSYNALIDTVSWNDMSNLCSLAEVLSALGGFDREACILVSAQFSRLDPAIPYEASGDAEQASEDEGDAKTPYADDEGDLNKDSLFICDGECRPVLTKATWEGHSLFLCMTCFNKGLCEDCYIKRQACLEDVDCGIAMTGYCGANHQYLKGPIEGWKGVKDGMMLIEGQNPVKFDEWLHDVKDRSWEAAWERFWLAEY